MITLPSAKGRTYGIIKDPYYSAVSLLLHTNGANGSTTFTDSGPNALSVTANGNANTSTAQKKFGSASASFDGTSNTYIYSSSNSVFEFGTGDFTVECWVYINSFNGTFNSFMQSDAVGISYNDKWWFSHYEAASQLRFGRHYTSDGAYCSWSPTTGVWYHVAACRVSGFIYLFIDGVSQSVTSNIGSVSWGQNGLAIGAVSTPYYLNGYVDDIRITKGVGRYKTSFALPTRPYPDYEEAIPADPYYSSTSLLLHMDGTNGSTSFIDSGPNAFPVTFGGSAQISTTQSKFGGASLAINDTSSYISLGAQSQFAFGTGDFTIEMWIQFTNSLANKNFIDFRPSATAGAYPAMYVDPTFRYAVNSFNRITSTTTPTLGQWYHVAVSRQSGSTRMFINGVQEGGTYTDSTNYLVARGPIIGNGWDLSVYGMTGFIDDLRITKGVARYNSNFTPPTKAYPNVYNPYASLPVNGAILWLDASKQSSLFTDAGSTNVKNNGDLVYQWNDLSGANNHATQSTSGSRPAWSSPANGQNVLGGVSFNGSTSIIYPTISSSDKTVFIVHKGISSSSDTRLFTSYSDYSLSVGASVYSGGNLSFVREYIVWANSGFSRVYNPTIFNLTYTNSPSFSATLSKSENSGNTTIQTITSTGTTSGLSDFFSLDGTFYEFILFTRALSAAEMTAMNSYLRTKWGTA
jgi:hypothetical protein